MTTREGGSSRPPFDSFNLGDHVGDEPATVSAHREALERGWGVQVAWLRQVHGTRVVEVSSVLSRPGKVQAAQEEGEEEQGADASWTATPGVACAVLVADCLPVLLASRNGRAVGAAHAGWRGLAGGVVEAAVGAVAQGAGCGPEDLVAWLGPCIGPAQFEVGEDVVQAFGGGARFMPRPRPDGSVRWLADLPGLARDRLARLGLREVAGGQGCTVSEPSRFFSFRRDGPTGRMAAAVWIGR